MKEILGSPAVMVIHPGGIGTNLATGGGAVITSAATASGTFDIAGASHATILVVRGKAPGTAGSGSTTTVSLLQSDDTNSSNFATYVADKTIAADTANAKICMYQLDCKGRKRYQKITITPGTTAAGTNDAVVGICLVLLSREMLGPTSAAALADVVTLISGQGTIAN